MKPEDHAWHELRNHAASRLRDGFADRVLRTAHGPAPGAWQRLRQFAAAQLPASFADQVMRAARQLPGVPSYLDQLIFSAGTAAVCVLAVFFFHARTERLEDERNLASWRQVAMAMVDEDAGR